MPRSWLASTLVTALLVVSPVACYNTKVNYATDGGAQFVYYSGKITGSFTHDKTKYDNEWRRTHDKWLFPCGYNGSYTFEAKKYVEGHPLMRIGVNGPWDTNPFFFSISRGTSDDAFYDSDESELPGFEFWTANYECFRDGVPCKNLKIEKTQWEWVPLQQLDLNAASISLENSTGYTEGISRPYYSVTGDSRTWVGNGRVSRNRAHFKAGTQWIERDEKDNCVQELNITWGADTNFTYAVKFNPDNVVASFNITVPEGVLSIAFDGFSGEYAGTVDPVVGDLLDSSHIAYLDNPVNYSLPHFTLSHGEEISWATDRQGRWYAKAATAGAPSGDGGVLGTVTVLTGVVACLLLM